MKKQISFFLCFAILLSLISCSEPQNIAKTDEGGDKTDLSVLSADELYQTVYSKTQGLSSAYFETEISFGEETSTMKTTLLRSGYDDFSYAREGLEKVYFTGEEIYVSAPLGNFSAPSTSRSASEYLKTYHFPTFCLEKETVSQLILDGLSVSYTVSDPAVLALYAKAVSNETFQPQSAKGVLKVKENGLLEQETITVSGLTEDGTEKDLVLKTSLVKSRSKDIALPPIPEELDFVSVGDVRIPYLISSSVEKLENQDVFQATILLSQTLSAGEKNYALHSEINCYQNEKGEYYLSRQTLNTGDESEESRFYQILSQGGSVTENEYDVIAGEKKSETISQEKESPWKQVVSEALLSFSVMQDLTLSQESAQNTISFAINQQGNSAILEKILSLFPQSGATAQGVESKGEGVFTISLSQGELTAFSYASSGSGSNLSFSSQCSVTVDETKSVELPQLQVPTPTTPGMEDENGEHQH